MKIRALLALASLLLPTTILASEEAEVIYTGGTILTMNDVQPRAESVAIADGKVLAVGSAEEVNKLKGMGTQIVDLKGQTMIPGFVDAHGHVLMIGLQALSANRNFKIK